ncbi:MAG: hypothetical protein Q8Q01_03995, partial [archaeon]|nr:hypothetical protein [archaeon]
MKSQKYALNAKALTGILLKKVVGENEDIYIYIYIIISCILLPSLVSASTTITDTSIESTGNLTIGQKITFVFGEILDNIVDGWLKITGNLNVTGNATISGTSFKVNNQEVCLADGTNC